jgi:hypothetical protein
MVVALFGLAACTNTTTGAAVTSSSGTTTSADTPSSTARGSGLDGIQPCDLLNSTELSQNGLTSKGPSTNSGARGCTWGNNAYDNGLGYTLGADIRDSQGIKDISTDGFTLRDDPTGHHQAKELRETSGDLCAVVLGVTATSRVDVSVNTGASDINQSCVLANMYAKLIEPKVP